MHPLRLERHVDIERYRAVHRRWCRCEVAFQRPDATLANLSEHATLGERRKRGGDEVEREAVQYCVRSCGIQESRRAHSEPDAIARAAQGQSPCFSQLGVFVRPPCRADGRSTQPPHVFDSLEPHATRCRMHNDRAACVQPGALDGGVRRRPRHGQRARLLKGQRRGLTGKKGRSRNRHACEWRVAEAECRAQRRRPLVNNTRRVTTGRPRVAWVLAEHVEYVSKVEADGAYVQEHLGVAQRR